MSTHVVRTHVCISLIKVPEHTLLALFQRLPDVVTLNGLQQVLLCHPVRVGLRNIFLIFLSFVAIVLQERAADQVLLLVGGRAAGAPSSRFLEQISGNFPGKMLFQ